jgi:predicted O-methyltransferase YrrM
VDELLNKIAAFIPTVHGWCSVEKAQWLARWIVDNNCSNVLEIGVFGGSSLVPMAMAMDYRCRLEGDVSGVVIGVDAYSNDTAETNDLEGENKKWWKTVDLKAVYASCQEAVIRNRVGHIVKFLICASKDAVDQFGDSSLDLVHVDGSHNEEESTRDVKMWWQKVRLGGIMVMDDTHWTQLVAARALARSLGTLIYHADTWEVYRKVTSLDSDKSAP